MQQIGLFVIATKWVSIWKKYSNLWCKQKKHRSTFGCTAAFRTGVTDIALPVQYDPTCQLPTKPLGIEFTNHCWEHWKFWRKKMIKLLLKNRNLVCFLKNFFSLLLLLFFWKKKNNRTHSARELQEIHNFKNRKNNDFEKIIFIG